MRIPIGLTRTFGRQILLAKKNSPHIFFIGGVVGVTGSAVLACRATLKLEKTLDEVKERVDKARVAEHITAQERPRVVAVVYFKGALKIGQLYAPSVVLGAASVAALTGAHVQLTRRNAALASTLALVSQAYDDYRERVRQELGEGRELELYRAMEDKEIEVDGKKKIVKVADPTQHSIYARCFDESNRNFVKNVEQNRNFLQMTQTYMNHRLNAYGHVFLNEVYDALGFERTSAGAVVGWLSKDGMDGYIDFKLFEPEASRFINGQECVVWLDFNVDGQIYTMIDNL